MRIQKKEIYAYSNGNLKKAAGSLLASRWLHLALAILLIIPALSAYGQFESASVLGYARDTSGAAVPGVTVTLTNTATGISQKGKTDSEGRYEFPSVPIGDYQVQAEAAGFERTQTQNFTVTTNARQRVDLSLKAGSVNETVTVTSEPTVLETETSSRGQVRTEPGSVNCCRTQRKSLTTSASSRPSIPTQLTTIRPSRSSRPVSYSRAAPAWALGSATDLAVKITIFPRSSC